LNKLIIGDQEFAILEQPLNSLATLYGAGPTLSRITTLRFEQYGTEVCNGSNLFKLFEHISKFIPLPLGLHALYIYNLFFIDYANSYHTYRHLYNLPVNGQRT
jgi:hypothetical protein